MIVQYVFGYNEVGCNKLIYNFPIQSLFKIDRASICSEIVVFIVFTICEVGVVQSYQLRLQLPGARNSAMTT